jgi:hypothetical protein
MINNPNTERAFSNTNLYGFGFNYAQQIEKDKSASVSKGGLNNVKETKKIIQTENPHTNLFESINIHGYGDDILRKTHYKPTIIDKLQYIQSPNLGYNNNRNLKILESIASTKQKEEKHHVIGMTTELLIDPYH